MGMNERERSQLLVLARESIRMRLLDAHELTPTHEQFPDEQVLAGPGGICHADRTWRTQRLHRNDHAGISSGAGGCVKRAVGGFR